MEKTSLSRISSEIRSCIAKQISPYEKTKFEVLEKACSLPSKYLEYLIPKIVLVDHYMASNLIKYLSKPDENKPDYSVAAHAL